MKQDISRTPASALFAAKGAAQPAIAPMRLMRQAEEQALAPRAARIPAPKDFFRVHVAIDANALHRLTEASGKTGRGVNDTMVVAIADYLQSEAARLGGCGCLLNTRG